MKITIKNLILLFTFSVLAYNCQKHAAEEHLHDELLLEDNSKFSRISLNDFLKNNTALSLSTKNLLSEKNTNKNYTAKNTTENLIITSDTINVVEKENYKSYTFRIKRIGYEYDTENLIIENKSGIENAYILSYNFDNEWIVNNSKEIHTEPKGKVYYTNFNTVDFTTIANKSSSNCFYVTMTFIVPCPCEGHVSSCNCYQQASSYTTTQRICGGGGGSNFGNHNGPLTTGDEPGSGGGGSSSDSSQDNDSETQANIESMAEFMEFKVNKLIIELELNQSQVQWISEDDNIDVALKIYDYVAFDNSWNEDAKEFAKLAVEAEKNNNEVNYNDKIIYTKNPCVNDIIKSLQQKDTRNSTIPDLEGKTHLSQMILDLFDHSKKYSLTFDIKQLDNLGSGVNGNTNTFNIDLDTDLVKNATQLFIAKTIIHESFHSFIHYIVREEPGSTMTAILNNYRDNYRLNNPREANNLTEHQFISEYVEALAYSLSSYDNHKEDISYYTALAWAGLESSPAYLALPNKTDIQKIIENERLAKNGAKSSKCP